MLVMVVVEVEPDNMVGVVGGAVVVEMLRLPLLLLAAAPNPTLLFER